MRRWEAVTPAFRRPSVHRGSTIAWALVVLATLCSWTARASSVGWLLPIESLQGAVLVNRKPWLGSRALLAVALLGAVLAVAFAFAPVTQADYVYTYRPAAGELVAGQLPNPAVAPLALARSVPDELRITLPCEAADAASSFSSMSLELWRSTEAGERSTLLYLESDLGKPLRVSVSGGVVSVLVSTAEVLRLSTDPVPGCVAEIRYADGVWEANAGSSSVRAAGAAPRFAEAVFAGPAASSGASAVTVRTRELGSSPSGIQVVLLVFAAALLAVVLREIWVGSRTDRLSRPSIPIVRQQIRRVVRLPDITVLVVLAAWVLFIPLNIDDGWIAARVGSYSRHGDIAGIFTADSAPMPFGYWLEWLQHFWLSTGDAPVVMRLPALLTGIATWFGLRSVGRSLLVRDTGGAVWLMAATFLVGFGAWGVTVRVEPVIAALMIASLAMAIRFDKGERGRVVVVWIAVVALAVTAHPAGIIVAAPALASWRRLSGWLRADKASRYTAVVSLLALGSMVVVLFFIDSNVTATSDAIDSYRSDAHTLTVFDESDRYGFLYATPYATPMRRIAVGSIFLGLGAFLLSFQRGRGVASLPGWSLLIGVVLLFLTPSKWPWHFGGLLGLVALVLVLEVSRLRALRAAAAMGGVAVVMGWAWSESLGWAVFDLRIHRWQAGATNLFPFDLSSPFTWAVLVALTGGAAVVWARRRAASEWSPPEVVGVLAMGLVVVVTGSTLAFDTLRTTNWTFGRQNIQSLFGDSGCGLGDEIRIPVPGSLHALPEATEEASPDSDRAVAEFGFEGGGTFDAVGYPRTGINRTLPVPGMGAFGSWVESEGAPPEANLGSHLSGWYVIEPGDEVALMVMGSYRSWADDNAVGVQWGAATATDVVDLGAEQASELTGYFLDWRMVEFSPPPGADRVRTLVRDGTTDSGESWVAASTPLGFAMSLVGDVAAAEDQPEILVSVAISPYFPCVQVPAFEGGVVPTPGVVIQTWRTLWQTTYAAAATSDRYFRVEVAVDPPLHSTKIGAHSGSIENFVFVSQEYFTGRPARANGSFERVSG